MTGRIVRGSTKLRPDKDSPNIKMKVKQLAWISPQQYFGISRPIFISKPILEIPIFNLKSYYSIKQEKYNDADTIHFRCTLHIEKLNQFDKTFEVYIGGANSKYNAKNMCQKHFENMILSNIESE